MTIDDQIKEEKLQYCINREPAKTGEEILPSNQKKIIEQAKFTCSPLGKAFEKQIKTVEDQGEKQVEALKDLKENKEKQIYNADDYENKLLISKEREILGVSTIKDWIK